MPSTTRRGLLATIGVATGAAGVGYWRSRDDTDCLERIDPYWTVRGRGLGWWTPPVVDDGTVFAGEGHGVSSSSRPERPFRLVALDGKGEARWALGERYAGWGVPAPTDERVYAVSGRNRVVAIERVTSRVEWTYHATDAYQGRGSWTRPVLTDGTVAIAVNDPEADRFDGDHYVVGIDRADGSERWLEQIDGRVETALRLVDRTLVAVTRSGDAYGLDPETGERRWSTALGHDIYFYSSGVIRDGRLLLPTLDGQLLALDGSGETVWTERLVDEDDRPRWADGKDAAIPALVERRDTLVVGDIAGRVRALDPADRSERWRYRATAAIAGVSVDGDRTAVLDQRGVCHLAETGSGERIDHFYVVERHYGDRCGHPPRHRRFRALSLDGHEATATGPWVRELRL